MGFLFMSGVGQANALTRTSTIAAAVPPSQVYSVSMTGYNAVPGQTDSEPLTTASGAYSDPDIVAARSVDLADELPFGTVIEIVPAATSTDPSCGVSLVQPLIGYRVIADSMNARMHNKIDILFGTDDIVHVGGIDRNPARALGFCRGTKIVVVGHVAISHMPKTQAELKAMLGQAALANAK